MRTVSDGSCNCFRSQLFNFVFPDYALNIQHLRIQKPFTYRHGESTFERYTEVENLGAALIHDPDGFIQWEGGQDIQGKPTYFTSR